MTTCPLSALIRINNFLYLVRFLRRQWFSPCKCSNKSRQGTGKRAIYDLCALARLHLFSRYKRRHNRMFRFQHPALRQPSDHRISRRFFPLQLFEAQLYKLAAGYWLMLPYDLTKTVFALKNLRCFQMMSPPFCLGSKRV